MSDWTFPQDWGTGSHPEAQGDPNDAANFGALVGATQPVSALISGLAFTVDHVNLTLDTTAGKVYLVGDSITAGTSGETRDEVGFVTSIDARTGLALTDSAVNHIFVETDPATDDSPSVTINTTDTQPTNPSVKIGEIDTTNDTNSSRWNLMASGTILTFPSESAIDSEDTAGRLPVGTNVYDRSTNSQYVITG